MSWLAAAKAAVGPVLGAATGATIGAASARKQASLSKQEAARNREFQERMSSTAYQRAADDLEAAGLNRILALGGPASSPGGAVADFSAYGSIGGAAMQGASVGSSAYANYTQGRMTDANVAKIAAEIPGIEAGAVWKTMQTELGQMFKPFLEAIAEGTQFAAEGLKKLNEILQDPETAEKVSELFERAPEAARNTVAKAITHTGKHLTRNDPAAQLIIKGVKEGWLDKAQLHLTDWLEGALAPYGGVHYEQTTD